MPELREIAALLRDAAEDIDDEAEKVVARGALNIKRQWRENHKAASIHGHAKLYPSSITYDIERHGSETSAEIGPDKNKPQGALGNLIEFGSVHNPPRNEGGRALREEEPRFYAALRKISEVLL